MLQFSLSQPKHIEFRIAENLEKIKVIKEETKLLRKKLTFPLYFSLIEIMLYIQFYILIISTVRKSYKIL